MIRIIVMALTKLITVSFFVTVVMISQTTYAALERDVYGGVVNSGFTPTAITGYFQIQKTNGRWTIVDPLGNPFFFLGVQNIRIPNTHDLGADNNGDDYNDKITAKYAIGQGPSDGFTDTDARWAYYTRERLKSWGFTVPSTYSYYPVIPSTTLGDPNFGNLTPNKMPYVLTLNPSKSAFDAGAKAIGPRVVSTSSAPIQYYVVDPYDPIFTTSTASVASVLTGFDDSYCLAVYEGEADEIKGISTTHGHVGFQTAAMNPVMTNNGSTIYADTKVYAKYALRDFLIARYGTIAALNAAWGTSYTTFDSSGTWGSGTGFLDEDGTHLLNWNYIVSSVPGNPAYPAQNTDLSDFGTELFRKFYSTIYNAYKAANPNYLVFSTNLGSVPTFALAGLTGTDGTPYSDIFQVVNADNVQAMYAATGRPIVSYMSPYPVANNDSPVSLMGTIDAIDPIASATEILVNSGFNSDLTGWGATNWTYSNGMAVATVGNTNPLTQTFAGQGASTTLKLTLVVANMTAGSITAKFGTTAVDFPSVGTTITADGTYTFYGVGLNTAFSITRTADFDGSIDSVSIRQVGEVEITSNAANFWWWDGSNDGLYYYAPYPNQSYIKFSSVPYYKVDGVTKYFYYFSSFPSATKMRIKAGNVGSNGTIYNLITFLQVGDTYKRINGIPWENTPDTQEARGQFYEDIINSLSGLSYNGDYYIVGADFWAWSDNNWIHSSYNEINNFGLVTTYDNAYDGTEATVATGTDTYGFAIGGEPGNYGDFITSVKAGNELIFSQFLTGSTIAAAPNNNLPAGRYNGPRNITLSTSDEATIYYTTDGTTPTESSTQYSGAIPVLINEAETTLKYFAKYAAGSSSAVQTQIYKCQRCNR